MQSGKNSRLFFLRLTALRQMTISQVLGKGFTGGVRFLGAGKLPIYVNSGSMTIVLRKKPGNPPRDLT